MGRGPQVDAHRPNGSTHISRRRNLIFLSKVSKSFTFIITCSRVCVCACVRDALRGSAIVSEFAKQSVYMYQT